ncbi:hypothetical protein QQP08_005793 [Theobroma cacao]|nr:hypothetical protein QQP08_005793 [Theobroma cacao]
MASHLNNNSEVEEEHSSKEIRSQWMRNRGGLWKRRRLSLHSGTSGPEFTATTGFSEARPTTEAARVKAAREAYNEVQNARQEALQKKKAERKSCWKRLRHRHSSV